MASEVSKLDVMKLHHLEGTIGIIVSKYVIVIAGYGVMLGLIRKRDCCGFEYRRK